MAINFSHELRLRIQYGVLLFALAIFLVSAGGFIYTSALILLACFCTAELFLIVSKNEVDNKLIYRGVLCVFVPILSLYIIREMFKEGMLLSFWFFISVAIVDTFAYFVGKAIGKHKLAPSISPSKTIEGFTGGVLLATLFSMVFHYIFGSKMPLGWFMFISFILAVLAQVSDLMESHFKRKFEVKDSSNLIPGHGGFLDRLDGYALTAPTLVVICLISKHIFNLNIFG